MILDLEGLDVLVVTLLLHVRNNGFDDLIGHMVDVLTTLGRTDTVDETDL